MYLSAENIHKFLKDLPFFKGISDIDVFHFIDKSNIKEYSKNQVIFLHGDNADRFFIVYNGWIKLHRETPEGEEAIIDLLTRGNMFGDTSIFCDNQYQFSAHCAEEAQLIEIPTLYLKEKALSNPEIMTNLLHMMCHDMKSARLENEHMAVMSAPQRLSCLLLQLSAGMVGNGGTFSFPYDKSLAATKLGMKPETFSRALAQLKPLGVSVHGSEITIDNFDALIKYSCSHCSAMPWECRKENLCDQQGCVKKNKSSVA